MKRLITFFLGLLAASCMAATHYVVTNNPSASDPYTSWATAGTSIIEVVNAALTNTEQRVVWVTNGTYYLSNQVAISGALTLQSVNGRNVTIVDGNNAGKPVSNRCFSITASGAVLDGFTVQNGAITNAEGGGGIYCTAGTTVKNCLITKCLINHRNDIQHLQPGWQSTMIPGSGICITNGVVTNCEITWNTNNNYYASVWAGGSTRVVNCTIASNTTYEGIIGEAYAAGICGDDSAVIENCMIYGNNSIGAGMYGGGVILKGYAIVRNSLIYGNSTEGSGGGIAFYPVGVVQKVQNCTVASNTASGNGGGIYMYVRPPGTACVENVVSYFNAGASGNSNYYYLTGAYLSSGSVQIVNSCIAPTNAFPTVGIVACYYANNIETDPQFAGKDTGDWRLTKTSPCVNAGTNETWMDGALDLDLHSRIDRFSRIVDMGCYEYLLRGTMFSGR